MPVMMKRFFIFPMAVGKQYFRSVLIYKKLKAFTTRHGLDFREGYFV